MTFEERKQAAKAVVAWLIEYHSEEVANYWAWECTPMPCGLPSDKQLEHGLSMALKP